VDGDWTPSACVIADSLSPAGIRLTTIEIELHRYMLPELNTHRSFSRNSASSRAIPVSRTLARLADTPAIPVRWPAEKKGMQGGDNIDEPAKARQIWLDARDAAVHHAEQLLQLGVHKSVVNRLLEPYMTHTVIVSATDWDGFWHQRCSPLAQDDIRVAAEAMRAAYDASEPRTCPYGRYHLPYIQEDEFRWTGWGALPHISAARCARVSYLTHDGRRDQRADLDLFRRLIDADPPHASPLEHVAIPARPGQSVHGNFRGWRQLRHILLGAP
jgi:hypothetical protein